MAAKVTAGGRAGLPTSWSRLAAATLVTLLALAWQAPPAAAEPIRSRQWQLDFLGIQRAHQISKGAGVTVAVVGTGVDAGHPDLAGNVLPGKDLLGDTRGQVDDVGHGTGMAALIAGHGHGPGNSEGVMGIAPKARILPVRVADPSAYATRVARGVRWAADHGAEIINVSIGVHSDEPALRRAVLYAQQRKDAIVVGSAGNIGGTVNINYPARYPGVIATSAVDERGEFAAEVSVTGERMELAAPGVDIVSATTEDGYARGSGTSSAAALVSGVTALVWSRYPDLDALNVIHRLLETASDKGPQGRDTKYGYGVIDPMAALTANVAPARGNASTSPAPAASPAGASGSGGAGPLLWWVLGGVLTVVVLVVAAVVGLLVYARSRRRTEVVGGYPPPPPGQPPEGRY